MNIKDFLLGYEAGAAQGGESGGGGGGSLPAGVYLSNYPTSKSIPKSHRRFLLNGELYATGTNSTSDGYLNIIYKWDGSAWATVLQTTSNTAGINGTYVDGRFYLAFEFNGKIHFFSPTGQHCAFDGTALTVYNALPGIPDNTQYAAIYQNKIVAYIPSTGKLYEWNETADTWATVATLASNSYTTYYLFSVNDELYAIYLGSCYHYENGQMVKISTSIIPNYTYFAGGIVYNGCLYGVYRQNAYSTLLRYNPQTDERAEWPFPSFSYEYWTIGGNDLSFTAQTKTNGVYNPCFVLHIIEDAPT